MDPLEGVFVFCFVFGVAISLFSFALGALHGGHGGHSLDGHGGHGAGGHGAIGDGGHGGGGHGGEGHGQGMLHGGHGGHGIPTGHGGVLDHAERGALHEGHLSEASPFNLQTITAFMAFFGGSGWVLYDSANVGPVIALVAATIVGVAGGGVVFWFLVKVLLAGQTEMDPYDSRIEGSVGHVTIPIQGGKIGEIVFSREGVRRSEGARSATGTPIARGTEVVIVRYEGGIAYVEPWTTYAGES
jgi:hypothetical protein